MQYLSLSTDLTWYLHESQMQSLEQFCNLTFREVPYLFSCLVFTRSIL